MAIIEIKDLPVETIIGTNPEERRMPQRLFITAAIETDISKAGHSDLLTDTLDYSQIERELAATASESSFYLLERLLYELAKTILAHPEVAKCRLTVAKPGASRLGAVISLSEDFSRLIAESQVK